MGGKTRRSHSASKARSSVRAQSNVIHEQFLTAATRLRRNHAVVFEFQFSTSNFESTENRARQYHHMNPDNGRSEEMPVGRVSSY